MFSVKTSVRVMGIEVKSRNPYANLVKKKKVYCQKVELKTTPTWEDKMSKKKKKKKITNKT